MERRSWFITGASAGIGLAVTEQLLSAGHRVAAAARRGEALAELATEYPEQLWSAELDVTDTARLREVIERVFAEVGRIDVVFSNAGAAAFGAAEELSDDTIDGQIALNMAAPIQLFRGVVPHLRAQGGGRFVQTSTMGAQVSSPGASMYHASKWGIEGFFESVIGEVAPFGIEVTMVEPGMVRTTFGANMSIAPALAPYSDTAVGRIRGAIESLDGHVTDAAPGDPGKVARAIIASTEQIPAPRRLLLGSDAYESVTGALVSRLDEAEASRTVAFSTDF